MFIRKGIAGGLLVLAVAGGPTRPLAAQQVSAPSDITVPGAQAPSAEPVPPEPIGPPMPEPVGPQAPSPSLGLLPGQIGPPAPASSATAGPAMIPAVTGTANPAVTAASDSSFWPSGRLPFHLSAKLGEIYDDNIFIQPDKTSDFITQLTLKSEIRLGNQHVVDGNYLDAFYAPTFALYADHSSEDYIDQDVGVFYQHRFSRLTLSADQTYTKTTATSITIGNLVTSDVIATNLKADYAYSDKLDIASTVTQTFTDYDAASFTNSGEWVLDTYFLYKWDSKLSFGFGPKFGFLDFSGAPLQTYQQFLPRVIYTYSDRLTVSLDGGLEYRQYNQDNEGDLLTGIFDISATYRPFVDTTLALTGSRHYVPAYGFIGQDYLASSVGVTGRQKFLKDFSFNLGFGYENDDYLLPASGFSGVTRNDDYLYATAGLDWTPNTWLVVAGAYRYQNDSSNFQAFSFDDNQLELSIEASY